MSWAFSGSRSTPRPVHAMTSKTRGTRPSRWNAPWRGPPLRGTATSLPSSPTLRPSRRSWTSGARPPTSMSGRLTACSGTWSSRASSGRKQQKYKVLRLYVLRFGVVLSKKKHQKICLESASLNKAHSLPPPASELQSLQVECNGLQKECSVLRADKQEIVNKHQKEKSGLQSECGALRAEKDEILKSHQNERATLHSECVALRSEKEALLHKQQQLEKEVIRSVDGLMLPEVLRRPLHKSQICPIYSAQLSFHSPFKVSVFLGGGWCLFVVCMLRMLIWTAASAPSSSPRRSWRRGWSCCSSSISRTTPSCRPSWTRRTAAARLCRERFAPESQKEWTDEWFFLKLDHRILLQFSKYIPYFILSFFFLSIMLICDQNPVLPSELG